MSWAHCPVSTLSLCLLAQCYQHVSQLVVLLYVHRAFLFLSNFIFSHLYLYFNPVVILKLRLNFSSKWINWCSSLNRQFSHVSFLNFKKTIIENSFKFFGVHCISSFIALRLSLVSQNTAEAQYLSHALFGILMLLPQTEAFTLLKNRLQCIPHSQAFQHNP